MKECIKCHQLKDESKFAIHHDHGIKRLRNVCKECSNNQRRQHSHQEHVASTLTQDVVAQFLDACDYKEYLIDQIPEEKFHRLYHVTDTSLTYDAIKAHARERLEELGYNNPSDILLSSVGHYIVIGDTFGKHTSTKKFEMLARAVKHLNAKAVISIGHHTDDYNDVSTAYNLLDCPVYMLPIRNELPDVHQFCVDNNMHTVLDKVTVGDVIIKNQEHITPYASTALTTLKPREYPGKCIVNCTRHEYYTRNSTLEKSLICSPGAMAEPHVIRTSYKLILQSGKQMNLAPVNKESFLKYRKNEVDKELWECGFIVITLNEDPTNGIKSNIEMVRVDDNTPACIVDTVYITNVTTVKVNPICSVLADMHSPFVDREAWKTLIVKLEQKRPGQILINGDLLDSRAFNPHNEREARSSNLLVDVLETENCVQYLSTVAPVKLITGNHEDFMRRFFDKYPQLEDYIYQTIYERLQKYCSVACNYKDKNAIYHITGDTTMLHGSSRLYGAKGSYPDQLAASVNKNVVIGHFHSPSIRQGVYTSGCLCTLDQGYNNPNISNWAHGYINVYNVNGFTFVKQEIF